MDMTTNMDTEDPQVILLTKQQKRALHQPGLLTVEKYQPHRDQLGEFIMNHSITQSLRRKNRFMLEEFVDIVAGAGDFYPHSSKHTHALGGKVMNIAINATQTRRAPSNKAKVDLSLPRSSAQFALGA